MTDRLVVDLDAMPLSWPLDDDALEDLRWYLEDYLTAPFGVYGDRGSGIEARLADWGRVVYRAVLGSAPLQGDTELVLRSASPALLGLPWELLVAPGQAMPAALDLAGVSRSLPMADDAQAVPVPGGKLRVLMVISRPAGAADVGYRMIARALLARLEAVRGIVEVVVLRPPTLAALCAELTAAAAVGRPYQVVHFDGHGQMFLGEGALSFESASGGEDPVRAARIAEVLGGAAVPVVVLNACQSGAVGMELEAAVATALLRDGVASVVAMAYRVYPVAAAEFMAAFYERLFAGGTVGSAVTAGRQQLYRSPRRPSPKGELPLADWLVPVHYLRREVSFPQAVLPRPAGSPSLSAALAETTVAEVGAGAGELDADGGVFVGRDALFYDLEAAARLQKVVVLSGPGGTGKTELAKAFGRWWRDTGGVDQPDGVFWHSFEPGAALPGLAGVITEIGLALDGRDFARLDDEARRIRVQNALIEHRMLLLWDNFESVRQMPGPGRSALPLDDPASTEIRGFLAQLAAHGKSAVVITSRTREEWLGPVRRIEVGGLTPSEAVEYANVLLAAFPAAQPRRVQRSFGELLEWLDGHPLAMRLTLPRLDTTDPADLLAELRGTILLPGDADAWSGRLSSLGACITHSFIHLTEQTRHLLPALSLFHGIADLVLLTLMSVAETAPVRFAGIGHEEWAAMLRDAARVGLLTDLRSSRYRIHPALPGYLAASWAASNPSGYEQERQASELALRSACADFSRWLTGEIAAGDATRAYIIIGLQRWTFGAMLGHAIDHHAWTDAEGIIRALDAYWDAHGLGGEAGIWADRILGATARPGQDPLVPVRSLWLYVTMRQATRQNHAGQQERAAQTYQRALAYLQGQPATEWTRKNVSTVYHQLGFTALARGSLGAAEDWYRKSLAIREELGDRPGMAICYHELGRITQTRGRLEEADDWYRKSLVIKEELGNRPGMAATYHQLGWTAQDRGQLDEAYEWYRKSLDIKEELGDRRLIATTCHQLGNVALLRGLLEEADEYYRRSLTHSEDLGNRPVMAGTYHQLGTTAQARGRLDEADDWYRKSLAISEELGNRLHMAANCLQLGMTALARGRLDEADDLYRKSLAISEETRDRTAIVNAYHEIGRTAARRGKLDEAVDLYRKSLAISEETGNRLHMAATYHQLGMTAQARGQLDEADDWYRKSLTIKKELRDRPGTAASYHQLGMTAQARGRLDEADDWYRKSLDISEGLSNRPQMAATYAQLGGLAEAQAQAPLALTWNVRSVALFSQFPSPLTETGPSALVRLTRQLGMPALEQTWQQTTGQALPQRVRDYIATQ